MNMTEWYYAQGQDRHGPVPEQTLRQLFQRGQVTLHTLVWREGMAQWSALSNHVEELQLQTLAATSTASENGGIDLRGDYAAIDNGTAPLPGSGPIAASPYAAPASALADNGVASVVQGGDVVYAGFWKRVAAYIVDYLILMVVSLVVGAIFSVMTIGAASSGSQAAAVASQLISGLVTFVLTAGYYAWFHASAGGATPGKMAIGIKVVRLQGERISIARAIGRYFASILSAVLLCVGYIMAAFTERKQGLHDIICDTVVVDRWAFTDQPHLQRRELGTVTIVILVVGAVLLVTLFAVMMFAAVMLAKASG